jgi:hypothetical protein
MSLRNRLRVKRERFVNKWSKKEKRSGSKAIQWISLVIAVMALVLTQFRPLYEYLDKSDLVILTPSQVMFASEYGSYEMTFFIQFRNDGRSAGNILQAGLSIVGKDSCDFRSDAFVTDLQSSDVSNSVDFISISLEPGELWEGYLTFREVGNGSMEENARQLGDSLYYIESNYPYINERPAIKKEEKQFQIIKKKYDSLLINLRHDVFQNIKRLQPGDYYLLLVIQTDEEKPFWVGLFEFTIKNSDIEQICNNWELYQPWMAKHIIMEFRPRTLPIFYTDISWVNDVNQLTDSLFELFSNRYYP